MSPGSKVTSFFTDNTLSLAPFHGQGLVNIDVGFSFSSKREGYPLLLQIKF